MPIIVGTDPGEYPPTVNYVVNGEPADDITFNRPTTDLDERTEVLRNYLDDLSIGDVAGLLDALNGDAPLHPNLGQLTALNYGANPEKIFALDAFGVPTFVPNTLQGENNTASNLGSAPGQLFAAKVGIDLQFRSLVAGTNVAIVQDATTLTISSSPGPVQTLTKSVKNTTGATIPALSVVSWLDDGSIALSDADAMPLSDFCGITLESIADGEFGLVAKLGNVPGALASLGASPGQPVYMGVTPGTYSLTPPLGLTDSIIMLGRAEPPTGVASGVAEDLYLQPVYVSGGGF